MPRASALILSCSILLAAATARAEIESALVKEGVAAWADLDYARAVTLLEEAQQESLTREEKIATYGTLALAHAALGNTADAKHAFVRLLGVDPAFALPRGAAPKVRALFEEAKAVAATSGRVAEAVPGVAPTLEPAQPREGEPLVVRVRYPGGVAKRLSLYHRPGGARAFDLVTAEGDAEGRFSATVPGRAVKAPVLQYHLALLDADGGSIAAAGSLATPLEVRVAARRRPVYRRGWFWALLGGALAAGAVAGALGATLPNQPARVEFQPL